MATILSKQQIRQLEKDWDEGIYRKDSLLGDEIGIRRSLEWLEQQHYVRVKQDLIVENCHILDYLGDEKKFSKIVERTRQLVICTAKIRAEIHYLKRRLEEFKVRHN